ncbi:MAG: hypothetical protein ACFCUL_14980 [Flavobacteriaceae bacterium]
MPNLLEKWSQATTTQQFLGMKIESNGSETIDVFKLVENPFETKKGTVRISSTYAVHLVGGGVGIAYKINDKGEAYYKLTYRCSDRNPHVTSIRC